MYYTVLCIQNHCFLVLYSCYNYPWQLYRLIKVKHPEKFPILSLFFQSVRKWKGQNYLLKVLLFFFSSPTIEAKSDMVGVINSTQC